MDSQIIPATFVCVLELITGPWLLAGCALPEKQGESDPAVSASYGCDAVATRRAVPAPELGARQTSFTVVGTFSDASSAETASEELRTALRTLLAQRDRNSDPLEAFGVEVEPALVEGLADVENSVTRLGRTVFLRSQGKKALDPVAFASLMGQLGADVLVEVPGHQRIMNVEVIWDTADAALDQALTEEIGQYLTMPYELMVRAPWAPGGITPEQAATRRHFMSIRKFIYTAVTPQQLRAEADEMIGAARRRDRASLKRIWDGQARQVQEQRPRRIREFLDAHPDFDHEFAETFLRWSTTFDMPSRYKLGAVLGARMGQLRYEWVDGGQRSLTIDPLEAYTGRGSMERSTQGQAGRLAASFIAKDIAVGLPALTDYLCTRGVEGVSYTITDFSDYM